MKFIDAKDSTSDKSHSFSNNTNKKGRGNEMEENKAISKTARTPSHGHSHRDRHRSRSRSHSHKKRYSSHHHSRSKSLEHSRRRNTLFDVIKNVEAEMTCISFIRFLILAQKDGTIPNFNFIEPRYPYGKDLYIWSTLMTLDMWGIFPKGVILKM